MDWPLIETLAINTPILENGKRIKCREKGQSNTLLVSIILEALGKTKDTEMEFTPVQMEPKNDKRGDEVDKY